MGRAKLLYLFKDTARTTGIGPAPQSPVVHWGRAPRPASQCTQVRSQRIRRISAQQFGAPHWLPPTTDENEVLRRMLNTPPQPHKAKLAPAKKAARTTKKGTHD